MHTSSEYFTAIGSCGFYDWLAEAGVSLAMTTHQAGKLVVARRVSR